MYFNFIPALSSLAISTTTNYYAPVNSLSITPFAAYSVPAANEDHVNLNNDNMQFVLDEILNSTTLGSNENSSSYQIWVENPVQNSLKIKSNYLLKNAQISITDFSGRKISEAKPQDLSGNVEIPVSLSSGVYLMHITSGKEKITKKILVKN